MSIYPGKNGDNESKGIGRKGLILILVAVAVIAVITGVVAAVVRKPATDKNRTVEANATEVKEEEQTTPEETTPEETTPEETTPEETTIQETTTAAAPVPGDLGSFQFEDTGDTKIAYLTFDDGPSDNTYPILDILDQYGVKATFFTIGKTDAESIEKYKAIVERGHALGMHSYSHDYSQMYASMENYQADVQGIHDLLYQVTGQDVRLYRFPGGSSNTVSNVDIHTLIDWVTSQGYIYHDWNVSSEDASGKPISAEQIIANINQQIEGYTRVDILMHDSNPKTETVRALPGIIESLQNAGYQIRPITNNTKPIQHVKAVYMQ